MSASLGMLRTQALNGISKRLRGNFASPASRLDVPAFPQRGDGRGVRPSIEHYQAVFITRLKPFTLPRPVAMSQPGVAPNAG